MLNPILKAQLCLLALMLALAGHACSVSHTIIPKGSPAPTPSDAPPSTTPEAPPDEGKTSPLAAPLLVRRLALDLTMRLPNAADAALINAGKTPQLITAYLNDRASAQALAALHPRMWHLASKELDVLDAFVAAGDTSLAVSLTTATRQAIVQEPSLAVRYVLEQQLPWHALFEAPSIITPASLLTLWQASDQGSAFAGESDRFATAFGTPGAAGLLVDPAFLASVGGDNRIYPRTGRIFKELLCLAAVPPSVHDFNSLSNADLMSDLGNVALTKKECTGCHTLLAGARQAYSGFASGSSFSTWLQAPTAFDTTTGSYGGATFQGLAALGKLVGNDPRMQRCEVLKLFEEIYQRPYTDADQTMLAVALDAFKRDGENLTSAAQELVLASDYNNAPVGDSVKGKGKRSHTGVKFLGRAQWEALFAATLPKNTLLFTDDLDPGQDEAFSGADHVPSGVYWHAVDRLARQAATAVVAAELADQVLATNRRLLTTLPDGAAASATAAVVTQQFQDLWLTLTGTPLTANDQILNDLQTLWNKLAPAATAEASRQAWCTILTAVFSHPALVSY